jgi:hypothetical protein
MSIFKGLAASFALALVAAAPLAAQQPTVTIDDDNITLRGCIQKVDLKAPAPPSTLVWSRSEIMMAGIAAAKQDAANPVGTSGVAGRVFYWLDNEEDFSEHVGQLVEVDGTLEDFESGEIEIKRDGEFTEIELDIDGAQEKARFPSSWFRGIDVDNEKEFEIVTRKIDVDEVRVVGPCNQ